MSRLLEECGEVSWELNHYLDNTLSFYEFLTAFSRIGWCIKREKTNEHFYFEFNNQIDGILEKYLTLR